MKRESDAWRAGYDAAVRVLTEKLDLEQNEWLDHPLEQWIWITEDKTHRAPWCVMVGEHVRARLLTKERAETVMGKLMAAMPVRP